MKTAVTIWRKQQKDKKLLHLTGTVISWTRILVAPPQFASYTPYIVVLVELADKSRMYGQLVDCDDEDITIGLKVVSTLRRMGEVGDEEVIPYGIKFKPIR